MSGYYRYCPLCGQVMGEYDNDDVANEDPCDQYTRDECNENQWEDVDEDAPQSIHEVVALMEMGVIDDGGANY